MMPVRCLRCGQYHGCPPWPSGPLFKALPAAASHEDVVRLQRERDALLQAAIKLLDCEVLMDTFPSTMCELEDAVVMCEKGEAS